MRNVTYTKALAAIAAIVVLAAGTAGASAQQASTARVVTTCGSVSPFPTIHAGAPTSLYVDNTGQLCSYGGGGGGGSFTGFTPTPAYASGTTGATDNNVALPTGTEFILYNTGAQPLAYNIGAAATADTGNISANSWQAIAGTAGAAFHYIEGKGATGTTTFVISGGAGIPTGAGGGSNGGGGGSTSQPFVPNGTYVNDVTATGTTNAAIPGAGTSTSIAINNYSLNSLLIKLSNSGSTTVTAATADYVAPPGISSMGVTGFTNMAYAPQSGTASVTFSGGAGSVNIPNSASLGCTVCGGVGATAPGNAAQMGVRNSGTSLGTLGVISGGDTNIAINISTAVTTQLIALSSTEGIYVASYDMMAAGTDNVTFEYGTGTLCAGGSGPHLLTGAYPLSATNPGLVRNAGTSPVFIVPTANALCVVTSAGVQLSGTLAYVQY